MNTKGKFVIAALVAACILLAGPAWGQDIKTRMHERLPQIVALKAAGVVGENNQGYLTILKSPTDKKNIVDAENQDRRTIYEAIAKKENTTPDLVGRRRAMQIAEKPDPGAWVQDSKGNWVQR